MNANHQPYIVRTLSGREFIVQAQSQASAVAEAVNLMDGARWQLTFAILAGITRKKKRHASTT